jgi:hypothetical protein
VPEYFEVHELEDWEPIVWVIMDPLENPVGFWSTLDGAEAECTKLNTGRLKGVQP